MLPVSTGSWESYDVALQGSGIELVSITANLVDLVWGSERPPVPNQPIYALQEAFTGGSLSFSFPAYSNMGPCCCPFG